MIKILFVCKNKIILLYFLFGKVRKRIQNIREKCMQKSLKVYYSMHIKQKVTGRMEKYTQNK